MNLRFLVDHCIPSSIIQYLRDANYEVLQLKEHLPVESPDQVVISKAQELNTIYIKAI